MILHYWYRLVLWAWCLAWIIAFTPRVTIQLHRPQTAQTTFFLRKFVPSFPPNTHLSAKYKPLTDFRRRYRATQPKTVWISLRNAVQDFVDAVFLRLERLVRHLLSFVIVGYMQFLMWYKEEWRQSTGGLQSKLQKLAQQSVLNLGQNPKPAPANDDLFVFDKDSWRSERASKSRPFKPLEESGERRAKSINKLSISLDDAYTTPILHTPGSQSAEERFLPIISQMKAPTVVVEKVHVENATTTTVDKQNSSTDLPPKGESSFQNQLAAQQKRDRMYVEMRLKEIDHLKRRKDDLHDQTKKAAQKKLTDPNSNRAFGLSIETSRTERARQWAENVLSAQGFLINATNVAKGRDPPVTSTLMSAPLPSIDNESESIGSSNTVAVVAVEVNSDRQDLDPSLSVPAVPPVSASSSKRLGASTVNRVPENLTSSLNSSSADVDIIEDTLEKAALETIDMYTDNPDLGGVPPPSPSAPSAPSEVAPAQTPNPTVRTATTSSTNSVSRQTQKGKETLSPLQWWRQSLSMNLSYVTHNSSEGNNTNHNNSVNSFHEHIQQLFSRSATTPTATSPSASVPSDPTPPTSEPTVTTENNTDINDGHDVPTTVVQVENVVDNDVAEGAEVDVERASAAAVHDDEVGSVHADQTSLVVEDVIANMESKEATSGSTLSPATLSPVPSFIHSHMPLLMLA